MLPLRSNIVVVAAALSTALALAVLLDVSPWLRGGYGWRWMLDPVPLVRLLPLLIALAFYIMGAALFLGRTNRTLPLLLWAVLGTVIISLAVAHARDGDALYALFTRTISPVATGPHTAAVQISWQDGRWLAWTEIMPDLNRHAAISPPGLPLWYALLNAGFDRLPFVAEPLQRALIGYQCHNYNFLEYTPAQWASTSFGILMPVWSGLTVFPLYAAARRIVSRHAGLQAALWWPLLPGIAAFAPSWNTLYPLICTLAFWMLLKGLNPAQHRAPLWVMTAGAVSGLGLFMNFALVPMLGVFGFYTLGHRWLTDDRRLRFNWQPVIVGVWFGIGMLLVPWVPFMLAGGDSPVAILSAAMRDHLELERPYWFWVVMHVWDWILWSGVGLFALALISLQRWRTSEKPPLLAASLLLTLLILTLSDTARGETGRVWLFFTPLLLIAAAQLLQELPGAASGRRPWLLIAAGQAALVVVVAGLLNAMGTPELSRPPTLPAPPADYTPIASGGFTDESGVELFRLEGWSAHFDRRDGQDGIVLNLRWRGTAPMTEPFWFGALPVQPDGFTAPMVLWQPGEDRGKENRYPTTCWQPNQISGDRVWIPLPATAPTDTWWISLAAFGSTDHPEGRLYVRTLENPADVQIGLGPVSVTQ